jgi:hypothetical protein
MKKITVALCLITLLTTSLFSAPAKLIMLRDNGPLRKANDSNGVEWAETVRAGTELELTNKDLVIKDLVTSSKTYKDVNFFEVKYNGETYYVQETDAEIADKLSVIQKDTVLYTHPSLSYFRNAMLETGSLVIAGDTYTQINQTFVKIIFYDTIDGIKRTRYVKQTDVSSSDKDVKAIILLENGRTAKSEELKKEFLNNAKSIKTSALIGDYIALEYNKILGLSSFSDDSIESYEAYATVVSNDGSKINIRSMPGTVGEVVGQIESADNPVVRVSLKLNEKDSIDNVVDFWYYITQEETGLEGWIFGGFLEF